MWALKSTNDMHVPVCSGMFAASGYSYRGDARALIVILSDKTLSMSGMTYLTVPTLIIQIRTGKGQRDFGEGCIVGLI